MASEKKMTLTKSITQLMKSTVKALKASTQSAFKMQGKYLSK
jgi:hypothetical protein